MHMDDKRQAGSMFSCCKLVWEADVINELFRNVGDRLKRRRKTDMRASGKQLVWRKWKEWNEAHTQSQDFRLLYPKQPCTNLTRWQRPPQPTSRQVCRGVRAPTCFMQPSCCLTGVTRGQTFPFLQRGCREIWKFAVAMVVPHRWEAGCLVTMLMLSFVSMHQIWRQRIYCIHLRSSDQDTKTKALWRNWWTP